MIRHNAPQWIENLKERFWRSTNGEPKLQVLAGEGRPSPVPDAVAGGVAKVGAAGSWLTAAASVPGSGHTRRGRGSDDWFELRDRDGVLYVVVADGMGSVPYGALGARVASKAAIESLLAGPVDPLDVREHQQRVRLAVGAAQDAIGQLATWTSGQDRDFAATLICAVVTKDSLAVGQVGDGGLVARSVDGTTFKAVSPPKGTYANETVALGVGEELLVSRAWRFPVEAVAAFTDGLERIALVRDKPYMPFLEPLWEFVEAGSIWRDKEVAEFLQSERMRQATDDDCTLVLAKPALVEREL